MQKQEKKTGINTWLTIISLAIIAGWTTMTLFFSLTIWRLGGENVGLTLAIALHPWLIAWGGWLYFSYRHGFAIFGNSPEADSKTGKHVLLVFAALFVIAMAADLIGGMQQAVVLATTSGLGLTGFAVWFGLVRVGPLGYLILSIQRQIKSRQKSNAGENANG